MSDALAQTERKGRRAIEASLVVNTLGGLFDINRPSSANGDGAHLPVMTPRIIRDGHQSGATAICTTIGHVLGDSEPFELTVRDAARWDAIIRENAADLVKVLSIDDVLRAKSEGKVGVVFATQNTSMIGTSIDRVDLFFDLGMRVFQLTYNEPNLVGTGALGDDDGGLTAMGGRVVDRINHVGAIVDLAHANERTTLDAMSVSRSPIAISHTGCRALLDHPRNSSDAVLAQIGSSGGYVGIYFMPFLAQGRSATSDDVMRHLDHAIDVAGEDSVGLGTDGSFTPIDDIDAYAASIKAYVSRRKRLGVSAPGESETVLPFIPELSGPDQFNRLADLLADRGYTDTLIRKIFGENFIRFAATIWPH